MVIVPYFPVRDEALKRIVLLKLGKIIRRLRESISVIRSLRFTVTHRRSHSGLRFCPADIRRSLQCPGAVPTPRISW